MTFCRASLSARIGFCRRTAGITGLCLAATIGCWQSYHLTADEDASRDDSRTDDVPRVDDAGTPDRAPDDAGRTDDAGVDAPPDSADTLEMLEWDLGRPRDAVDYEAEAPPPIVDVPGCGNGTLDPGEECDDRNRLNGDGCDWLCRLGDGEPPPTADPDAATYVPSGDPVVVEPGRADNWRFATLPLTWSGSAYATVVYGSGEEGEPARLTFFRFDRDGRRFGSSWGYEAPTLSFGHDLVWNGDGYGLFFSDSDRGIFFVRLDAEGKPLGEPVLVEPDPRARGPNADLLDDGYVLAWVHEGAAGAGWSQCGDWYEPPDSTRLRYVGWLGETSGEPLIVESASGGSVDVAAGDGGFGLSVSMNSSPELPSCAQRFAWVAPDFSGTVASGILSNGVMADVKWVAGRYYTAWTHIDTALGGDGEICVARFTPDGTLELAPVCNPLLPYASGDAVDGVVRIAAGGEGLAVVVGTAQDYDLAFLRTDLMGVAVAASCEILPCPGPEVPPEPWECSVTFGAYNTVWADHGFGVLFNGNFRVPSLGLDDHALLLQTFVAE